MAGDGIESPDQATKEVLIKELRKQPSSKVVEKKVYIEALEKGFSTNWNCYALNPDFFATMVEDTLMLTLCDSCLAPNVLHLVQAGEECELDQFPSESNCAINVHLEKIEQYRAVKAIAVHREKTQKQKMTEVTNVIKSEKRSSLPPYTKDNYTHWEALVKTWDTNYPNVTPLDKYLEILKSLRDRNADNLADKLQTEGLDYSNKSIITIIMIQS